MASHRARGGYGLLVGFQDPEYARNDPGRATLKVMKSIMIADQLREAQAYGQQRTAELGIDASDVPARVQEFLKAAPKSKRG